ncbi:unnamed protein product [Linum tenue]|uniref:Uncharacterized protein n=1 Tax=Linum tenue TaxID=586396 RepID=A0AAV0GVG1_9ROSI|nr:unnamed protein product [Linum tenue]
MMMIASHPWMSQRDTLQST